MAIGGDGGWSIATMWALTVLTFVFVLLRLYTRYFLVQSVGIDDHVYNLAFILLLCYTIFLTVSATRGFGQHMDEIKDPQDVVDAVFFEAIGQLFAVTGMAVAKWSLGLFLLRIVQKKWHMFLIWTVMGCLMAASISVCFVFMLQCTPPAYLWDRRIEGGFCHIDSAPVSMLLCILCVTADFFFAIFPWTFIWQLNMNQREKTVILVSMSLGVIAGACGIKRTLEVPALSKPDYLKVTVGLIVWSAAEIAVTMICIGIPVCRPLYKQYLDKLTSNDQSKGADVSGGPNRSHEHPLRTFGGTTMHRLDDDATDAYSRKNISSTDRKIGVKGPFNQSYAVGGRQQSPNNSSDEEILGPEFRQGHMRTRSNGQVNGIRVTEEYRVMSSKN